MWQGSSAVLITGSSDRDRVFYPFLLSVIKGETTEDFEFIFRKIHKIHSDWIPITNALTVVFGEFLTRLLMCYFHVTENT